MNVYERAVAGILVAVLKQQYTSIGGCICVRFYYYIKLLLKLNSINWDPKLII